MVFIGVGFLVLLNIGVLIGDFFFGEILLGFIFLI